MLQVIGALTLVVGGLALTVWAAGLSWRQPSPAIRRPALGAVVLTIVLVLIVATWPNKPSSPAQSTVLDQPKAVKPQPAAQPSVAAAPAEPLPTAPFTDKTGVQPEPPLPRETRSSKPSLSPEARQLVFETAVLAQLQITLPRILGHASFRRADARNQPGYLGDLDRHALAVGSGGMFQTPLGTRIWVYLDLGDAGAGVIGVDVYGIRRQPPQAGQCEELRIIASLGIAVPLPNVSVKEAWSASPRPRDALLTQFDMRACVDAEGRWTATRE